ncbi:MULTISPECIES: cytochrome P450 [unclassified Streptomyces]|uniref:cytochrome P450 family protein n=1 Tax=unclassified Streptomyces TaxID=2593676 RepID=UPI001CBEB760|nr:MULTISPECIES: cytochrome P450 [unclassified Streptomyces]WPO69765.1 cytochrome P450 [Streptomyces sp. KN37]
MNPTNDSTATRAAESRCPVDPGAPFGDTFHQAPQAVLAWFREHRPVAEVALPNGLRAWMLTRDDDVRAALGDPRLIHDTRRFPQTLQGLDWNSPAGDMISAYGRNLSSADAPEHDRYHATVAGTFTARRTQELRPRVQEIVDALLDRLPTDEPVDLLGRFTVPLSVGVMCEIVGVPETDRPDFLDFVRRTVSIDDDLDIAGLRTSAMRTFELLTGYVADRARDPHKDLLGEVTTQLRQEGSSAEDVVTVLYHLLVAGFDTTGAFIGNMVQGLLDHPEVLAAVREDPARLSSAVEEFLRFDGSARMGVWRFAAQDVEVGGQLIPAGSLVMVSLAAANRDPARFVDADRLDLERGDIGGHVAFGRGRHRCTGAALARLETEVAVGTLVRRHPRLRIAADETLRRRTVVTLNGLRRLPVVLGTPVAE